MTDADRDLASHRPNEKKINALVKHPLLQKFNNKTLKLRKHLLGEMNVYMVKIFKTASYDQHLQKYNLKFFFYGFRKNYRSLT